MRTSLNEVKRIDDYLLNRQPPEQRLVFEAEMLLDPRLASKVADQQQALDIIKTYSRKQLRKELTAVDHKLFTKPQYHQFRQRILGLFKP